MRVVIISDIHDNLVNLGKCLEWCQNNNIQTMICCGDAAKSETLKFLANRFSGTIHLVRGNADIYDEDKISRHKNIRYYGAIGRIEIGGRRIGICHEPRLIPKVIAKGGSDIIFYGHTHKPWIAKKQKIITVNPGTLSGLPQLATFSAWNTRTGAIELITIENLCRKK